MHRYLRSIHVQKHSRVVDEINSLVAIHNFLISIHDTELIDIRALEGAPDVEQFRPAPLVLSRDTQSTSRDFSDALRTKADE